MLPVAKWPSSRYLRHSAAFRRSICVSSGVPKFSATLSTSVEKTSTFAPNSRASRQDAASLSMTAGRGRRDPSGLYMTGIPPPPAATTSVPLSSSVRIAASSMISIGSGDGTTLRQPRFASSAIAQPSSSACCRASDSLMNGPMGLVGLSKLGSSGSTTTCVTMATTGCTFPWLRNSFCSDWAICMPIEPCVSATQFASGTWCNAAFASSERSRMNPTCGPLP